MCIAEVWPLLWVNFLVSRLASCGTKKEVLFDSVHELDSPTIKDGELGSLFKAALQPFKVLNVFIPSILEDRDVLKQSASLSELSSIGRGSD